MPAAQEVIESRRSHGFFTMSSSNRWNRTSAAEAPSSSSDRRRQEFPDSQSDDELRHSEPTEGYAQRKHEEVPHERLRTPATFPTEDHMAFSAGYRFNTAWFNDSEFVNKKRERNMHCIHEPNNMNPFDRHQMCMDVISWILYWGTEHEEVDVAIKWLAEFLKFLCGYTTQEEENWFDGHIDLTNKNKNYSRYLKCSKALARELRHSSKKYLFDPRGGMNITDLFDLMEGDNPKHYGMSGAQFAAFLLCNPKQRFFVDIYMQWEWYPYSSRATYPFDVRLCCTQGHSNEVVDPWTIHHPLTYDEAMCLGWIFHVTTKWPQDQSKRKWTSWKRRSTLHVTQ